MHVPSPSVGRARRQATASSFGPIGRSVLPVLGMVLLTTATACGAWLVLFAVAFGFRLLTHG